MGTVKAVKCIGIPYQPSENLFSLLESFKNMVNYCIRIGLEKGITSRFRLSNEVYRELAKHGFHSWYSLSAIEVATAILKNYRKAERRGKKVGRPRAGRLMAKLGNQAYKVVGDWLRIPIKPRQYFYISLHKRAKELLTNPQHRPGSITLTADMVFISFSKTVRVEKPKGYVAIDVNEDNVTALSSDGEAKIFNLSKLKEASYGYFCRRRRVQQKYCGDRRVLRKALSKLSKNYRNKASTTLHQVSTAVVKWCSEGSYGLIHEDLKGLRESVNKKVKRFNRFNGKVQLFSTRFKRLKRRLNGWWFRKFLNMLDYKAKWNGVEVIPSKHTKGSSSTCPICGSKLKTYPNRQVKCLNCGYKNDRDVIACLNLLRWEVVVQPQPPLRCSRDPCPNKPCGDEEKRGEQKGGSPVSASTDKWTEPISEKLIN